MSKRSLGDRFHSSNKRSKLGYKLDQNADHKSGYVSHRQEKNINEELVYLNDSELNLSPDTAGVSLNSSDYLKNTVIVGGKISTYSKSAKLPLPRMSTTLKQAKIKSYQTRYSTKSEGTEDTSSEARYSNAERYEFDYLKTPLKSMSDKKEYKVIKLKNGLRAILISDVANLQAITQCEDEDSSDESDSETGSEDECASETCSESASGASETESESGEGIHINQSESDADSKKKVPTEEKMSALGLTIGVGSFSDPENIPGLAHFLEHMVFMGSNKYPKENHFDSFIKRQGGSDNAHTDCETTTFYFECQEKYLLKGMDKFVEFFKAPLMKKEAMTRERQAVESEFQESMSSDYHRCVQLLASLAKSNHPATKFTWGNAATLHEGITDAKLHKALHSFRKRHYSAHRMTLAVQARLPMEELEVLVAKSFSSVIHNNLPSDDFTSFEKSFDTPEFHRLYRVNSIKDRLSLKLTWMLPPCLHLYRSKPYQYLESVLDHEGKGTLLHHLRHKLWALSLEAVHGWSGFENNSMYFLFTIDVKLTEEGYKNINNVVTAVFGYLKMLQHEGPNERFFSELKTMSEANFNYCDESAAADYVEALSEGLQYYAAEDCIAAPHLIYDYQPKLIKDFQDALTVDSVNIIIASMDDSVTYDKEEKWFKTKYNVNDIPEEWLLSWNNADTLASFSLPEPNKFLPTDFSLLPSASDEFDEEYPIVISATQLCEVWYKRDKKFHQPIAYYFHYLISPLLKLSAKNAVLLELYADLLEHDLSTELYAAKAASISYCVQAASNGLLITVSGFNEGLPNVLETIFKQMATFHNIIQQELFNAIKDNRTKMYFNTFLKPGKLNSDLRLKLIVNNHWTSLEKHAAIEEDDVNLKMMVDFVKKYHSQLYIQSLVQGNVSRQDALSVVETIKDQLDCVSIPQNIYPEYRVSEVKLGKQVIRVQSFNLNDPNSVITNYYQAGPGSILDSCLVELTMTLMEEPLFDKLRTKEQLGYDVDCEMRDTHGILGFTISVNYQENKRSIADVDCRIEAFLKWFHKTIDKMTQKKLDEARMTLIKLKQCTDVYLKEEVGRNWSEVLSNEYLFDRQAKEIKILESITLAEVKQWTNKHVECSCNTNFRELSIQVIGQIDVTDEGTQDITALKTPKIQKAENLEQKKLKCLDNSNLNGAILEESLVKVKFPLKLINKGDKSFIGSISDYRQSAHLHPLHKILA